MIQIIRLTLLNHLFYYTEVTGGSTSATITGGFLGDLALTYALAGVTRKRSDTYKQRLQPEYSEIKDFGFYCTVARPEQKVNRTNTYIQNTLFTDGYPDVKSIEKSGKSPFKNFRQVQGIAIGNTFLAAVLSKEELNFPPVIRLGRQKETLIGLEKVSFLNKENDNIWLNAFTLRVVFDNLDNSTKILLQGSNIRFTHIIEQYFLIQNVSINQVKEIFKDDFGI